MSLKEKKKNSFIHKAALKKNVWQKKKSSQHELYQTSGPCLVSKRFWISIP
jgi:hypothetical protein